MSEQELLVILRRARATLSDSSHFSPRHFAEDAHGRWIPVGSSRAARFNLEGAIMHAAGTDARDALAAIFEIFRLVSHELSERLKRRASAPLTHVEALEALDQAIAYLAAVTARHRSGTSLRAVTASDLDEAAAKLGRS